MDAAIRSFQRLGLREGPPPLGLATFEDVVRTHHVNESFQYVPREETQNRSLVISPRLRGNNWTVCKGVEPLFERRDVRRVKINGDVVPPDAFAGCVNLRKVELANATTVIGEGAFRGCKRLRKIDLRRVTEIENKAFEDCAALASVDLAGVSSIGNGAFNGCTALRHADLAGASSIGDKSFRGCRKLKSVSIPPSVMKIGKFAFLHCKRLRKVEICEGVQQIGALSFKGCRKLKRVSIPSTVSEVGDRAFEDCTKLQEIELREGLETIGESAFQNCGLKGVTVPSTVTWMDECAFADCSKMTAVNLCDGLTTIGPQAFRRCYKLKSIKIPSTVERIEEGAFEDCANLRKAVLHPGLCAIGAAAFNHCWRLENVLLPSTLREIDKNAFQGCTGMDNLALPHGLETMGRGAFGGCRNLRSVSIPSTVPAIEAYTFADCHKVQEIELYEGSQLASPAGLRVSRHCTIFCERSFVDSCERLESLVLCDQVQYIHRNAFQASRSLFDSASIDIPTPVFAVSSIADGRRHCRVLRDVAITAEASRFGVPNWTWVIVSKWARSMSTTGLTTAEEKINEIIDRYELIDVRRGLSPSEKCIVAADFLLRSEFLSEATSILELAIWKSKIDELMPQNTAQNDEGRDQHTARGSVLLRNQCRIDSGAHIILPLVIPFLNEKSCRDIILSGRRLMDSLRNPITSCI